MKQAERYTTAVATAVPGGTLLAARPLSGGISAQMTALDIFAPDGQTLTLILRQGSALAQEYRLLTILESTGLPAPRALALTTLEDEPALLLEYVAGEMRFSTADLAPRLPRAAAALAAIHDLDTAVHDLSFLPRQAGWCTEAGDGAGGWALDTAPVAAALRQAPPQSSNAPVLLHGDYWPGNWLWQNGRLAAIIDWEDAALGDPLRDLAQSRLELAWIHDAEAAAAFTRAYLARRPLDTGALPYWDLCAALRLARLVGDDLAGWASLLPRHTAVTDITPGSIRAAYEAFTAAALAKIRP